MNETKISASVLETYPKVDQELVNRLLAEEVNRSKRKIVVLDDDPTGVQTVHDVSVYTNWSKQSIQEGFLENQKLFFILTNSRSFTVEQTTEAHRTIASNVEAVAKSCQTPYLIISRGDSTLRGHYPLETELLRETAQKATGKDVDGELLCPYFKEGGRFTLNNIHYVKYGEELVPAGETEFAKDETFGYRSSNLCEYIEEKTKGVYKKEDCICISLEEIRSLDLDAIEKKLLLASGFAKIVVNAIDDVDVKIVSIALYRALAKGHTFLIRSAAAFVKAMGNISDKPLLTKEELLSGTSAQGGIIVVGSHTQKTTQQLEELKTIKDITFIEMNSDLVLQEGGLEQEVERILQQEEALLAEGKTVCVSTKRALLKVENDTPQEALLRSVAISNALKDCVGKLNTTPAFVIAKGGITSSDVGTKALCVTHALVLGQIQPGIPVWKTGEESRFPGIPYIIFPGNVGEKDTLCHATEILLGL